MKDVVNQDLRAISDGDSSLRLQTIVRLRWLAVLGQLLAIGLVSLVLGFELPMGPCLALVALSAWLNVYLSIQYPARHRMSVRFANALLTYDVLQLSALLYLTGGIDNPFSMLIVAPVTVSAATLPLANTIMLGSLAAAATALITFHHLPLPWHGGQTMEQPLTYKLGMFASVLSGMTFLALYAWRLTKESRQMSAALAATELVLAREQKLHALDGLAAAAAHELGTPLSTITLVTNELDRQLKSDSPLRDDIVLLRSQAQRCREILRKLTRHPAEQDPLHSNISVKELLAEAGAPHEMERAAIVVNAAPMPNARGAAAREPVILRRPGVLYGLGNIIENAVDFADTQVDLEAAWDDSSVVITVSDDGPGFKPEIMDTLGEPYVTTRPASGKRQGGVKAGGLGLGFFIAKTLLERSGATIALENRPAPRHGAVVRLTWSRAAFEAVIDRAEEGVSGTA